MNPRNRIKAGALAALLVALFGSTARADGPPGLFDLLLGFSAKETCSCAFVVQQSDAYCNDFGQFSGFSVTLNIDHAARSVSSTFQGITRTAVADASGACSMSDAK